MDFLTLNQLLKCDKEFSHKKLCKREFTDTEFMICSFICSHEGCSQDDVAKHFRLDKTTVTKAIQKLEERKCLLRKNDPQDKRRKNLYLTDATKAEISDILSLHEKWMSSLLKCLSEDEQKQFESYCLRLLDEADRLMSNHTLILKTV